MPNKNAFWGINFNGRYRAIPKNVVEIRGKDIKPTLAYRSLQDMCGKPVIVPYLGCNYTVHVYKLPITVKQKKQGYAVYMVCPDCNEKSRKIYKNVDSLLAKCSKCWDFEIRKHNPYLKYIYFPLLKMQESAIKVTYLTRQPFFQRFHIKRLRMLSSKILTILVNNQYLYPQYILENIKAELFPELKKCAQNPFSNLSYWVSNRFIKEEDLK